MVEVVDRREGDDLDEVALEFFSSNGARRCESMRLSVLSEHRIYLVADLLMLLMTSGLNLASTKKFFSWISSLMLLLPLFTMSGSPCKV